MTDNNDYWEHALAAYVRPLEPDDLTYDDVMAPRLDLDGQHVGSVDLEGNRLDANGQPVESICPLPDDYVRPEPDFRKARNRSEPVRVDNHVPSDLVGWMDDLFAKPTTKAGRNS